MTPRPTLTRSLGLAGLAALLGAAILLPVYWMLVTALRPDADLFAYPPRVLPRSLDFRLALATFAGTPILTWLGNSTIVAVSTTLVAGVLGIPAGYALSRYTRRGVRAVAGLTLVTQMMPPLLLLVPMFLVYQRVGLLDSLLALVLTDVAWVLPLTVWMMKSMFDTIPLELDDAARVDGCSPLAALLRVIVPLALPGLGAVAIYAFIETWDEFLFARTFVVSSERWTASVGLYAFEGQYVVPQQQVMAAAILFSLPPMVLFLFVRRAFIAGLGAGAVKG
jgi:multiple sugar transport system permease protein